MVRKFGPFDTSQFYEVENRRLQRAFNDATGFIRTGQGAVTAGTGAQLVIAAYPDGALIDGLYVENPATETVTLTTNTGNTNPRIDRLVMRLDMTAKTIAPFQIVGTPAASPTIPPIVQNATTFDMPLCRYTMPGSASAQNPGSIVDERVYAGGAPVVQALTPATSWVGDPNGWGAPEARLMPWGEVRLSGMLRRSGTATGINADPNSIYQFTEAVPVLIRPNNGQRRLVGTGQTPSGPCGVWLLADTNAFGFSFSATTPVYNTVDWYVGINSLSYFK